VAPVKGARLEVCHVVRDLRGRRQPGVTAALLVQAGEELAARRGGLGRVLGAQDLVAESVQMVPDVRPSARVDSSGDLDADSSECSEIVRRGRPKRRRR